MADILMSVFLFHMNKHFCDFLCMYLAWQLRCTYRAYDAMDEITAAYSIAFNPLGNKWVFLSTFADVGRSNFVYDKIELCLLKYKLLC